MIFIRYLMGTAYLPSPLNRIAYKFFEVILPKPSHKIYLNISPAEAHRRISTNRREKEMFESLSQLRKIGRRALEMAALYDWIIVEAGEPEEAVEKAILSWIDA